MRSRENPFLESPSTENPDPWSGLFGKIGLSGREALENKPLPAIEVESAAREVLLEMGLSEGNIESLQTVMHELDYDNCEQKVDRIVKEGGITWDSEESALHMKGFHDLTLGQCGPLAWGLMDRITKKGDLLDLLTGKTGLRIAFCNGKSPTHFKNEGSNHCWLKLEDKQGKSVILDPSFRKITVHAGYVEEGASYSPSNIEVTLSAKIKPGKGRVSSEGISIENASTLTIGVSRDRKIAYSLLFASTDTGIIPLIQALDEDGISSYFFMPYDSSPFARREMASVLNGTRITAEHAREAKVLLAKLPAQIRKDIDGPNEERKVVIPGIPTGQSL